MATKKQSKSKVAQAVIETVGAERYEALLSPEQITATAGVVEVLAEAKVRQHDTKALTRAAVQAVFPVGKEPDKATWSEWCAGVAEQVASLCFTTIEPPAGETDEQAKRRFDGLLGYAKKALREAYQSPEDADGNVVARALPEAGRGQDGAVPPGMNIRKATRGFASKVMGAVEYSAKLADYPYDGKMLIRVAKWAEDTLAMLEALEADAKASAGEKAA